MLLALLGALAPAGWAQDSELARAKSLLQQVEEGQVGRGVQACVKANNVAAVELMLAVLNRTARHAGRALAPAHYRDMMWSGLIQITDKYAQDRVEREYRTNKKSGWVRQWCVELLGIYGKPRFGPTLVKATSDRDVGVRRWAARSLGMVKFEKGIPALRRLAFKKDPVTRANAIEALARIRPQEFGDAFREAIRSDADAGVRCALLGAVFDVFWQETVGLAAIGLKDADWRPRMQAVDSLAKVRTKKSVDVLIEGVKDGRPVVKERAIQVLRRFTHKEIRDYRGWKEWWSKNRESFEFPEGDDGPEKSDERKTVAYGIPLVSDHVAFILDKSARMADRLEATGTSKDKAAYQELERVLSKLHGRLVFNVHCYREDVKTFRKQPSQLDQNAQDKALRFHKKQSLKGAKDIWKVLEKVLSDPTLDTAYLLSSGEPDVGLYVHWNRVTRHLKDLNRFHKVTVHTVVYSERKWYRDQLHQIALATGGDFKWFK